jgi:class 3 adenylate cyclase
MSGFTRIVKQYGPIHYTTLIALMREITLPIQRKYKAEHIFYEADNVWCVFPDAVHGVKAGAEMLHVVNKFNETISLEDYKIKISGIGVNIGDDMHIDREDGKIYGTSVSIAFKLGEDIGEGGEVLFTTAVKEAIKDDAYFKNATYTQEHSNLYGGFDFHRLRGNFDYETEFQEPSVAEDHPFYLFLQRRAAGLNFAEIDKKILEKYQREKSVVVMYGCDWTSILSKHGIQRFLECQAKFSTLLTETFAGFDGRKKDLYIYLFNDPVKAVLACAKAREIIRERYLDENSEEFYPLDGFGLHCGNLLQITGTEIMLGDAINTASKLGEDIATGQQINVSADVYLDLTKIGNEEICKIQFAEKNCDLGAFQLKYHSYI